MSRATRPLEVRPLDAEAFDAASLDAARFTAADLCSPPGPARSGLPLVVAYLDGHGAAVALGAQGLGSAPVHLLGSLALGLCAGRAGGSFAGGWVLAAWFGALRQLHLAFLPGQVAGFSAAGC